MKRKVLSAAALALLVVGLSGCCLSHEWMAATCKNPMICIKCHETKGEALGHSWVSANCENPKVCIICGHREGDPLGHSWEEATCEAPKTCSVCGKTEGEALDHKVKGYKPNGVEMIGTCTVCGGSFSEELDWEKLGLDLLTGQWFCSNIVTTEGSATYPANTDLEIKKDGSVILHLAGSTFSGHLDFYEHDWDTLSMDAVLFLLSLDDMYFALYIAVDMDNMLTIFDSDITMEFVRK